MTIEVISNMNLVQLLSLQLFLTSIQRQVFTFHFCPTDSNYASSINKKNIYIKLLFKTCYPDHVNDIL